MKKLTVLTITLAILLVNVQCAKIKHEKFADAETRNLQAATGSASTTGTTVPAGTATTPSTTASTGTTATPSSTAAPTGTATASTGTAGGGFVRLARICS